MFNTSQITIDKEKFIHNLTVLKEWIEKDVKLSSVVKGNAYGHGIETFVPLALDCGIDHFSVFSADEAHRVKNVVGEKADILIMGDIHGSALDWAIENRISFYLFDLHRLKNAKETAKRVGVKAKIHLQIETGMNRMGIEEIDLPSIAKFMQQNKEYLQYEGLCTHFAGAESIANYIRIEKQKKKFLQCKEYLESQELKAEINHTCGSAATIRNPEMQMDMVRIGILQYGLWPSREILIEYLRENDANENPLRRILSWKTEVMTTKLVRMGEYIGYGNSYLASTDTKIAVIPIGYANGFTRSLSNQGRALVGGERVPVVGMVNMSCVAIDINNVPETKIGDEVVLIGHQNDKDITISSFTEISEQVNYEMLTRLPQDIPRAVL